VSLLLFWCAILGGGNNSCYVLAEEEKSPDAAAETSTSPDAAETTTTTEEVKETKPHIPFSAQDHTDWGNYYDPQNVFCGKYDCYKILGFDYENFGSVKPDTKVITKRYRSLSREWHPDKSKHKDAKERFVVSTSNVEEKAIPLCWFLTIALDVPVLDH
jgi:DnaJ family protein C protein 25